MCPLSGGRSARQAAYHHNHNIDTHLELVGVAASRVPQSWATVPSSCLPAALPLCPSTPLPLYPSPPPPLAALSRRPKSAKIAPSTGTDGAQSTGPARPAKKGALNRPKSEIWLEGCSGVSSAGRALSVIAARPAKLRPMARLCRHGFHTARQHGLHCRLNS